MNGTVEANPGIQNLSRWGNSQDGFLLLPKNLQIFFCFPLVVFFQQRAAWQQLLSVGGLVLS